MPDARARRGRLDGGRRRTIRAAKRDGSRSRRRQEPTCEEPVFPTRPPAHCGRQYAAFLRRRRAAPRPLSVTHAYRAAEFGRCALLRSAARRSPTRCCSSILAGGRPARRRRPPPPRCSRPPRSACGGLSVPLADGAELDPSAIALQLACDASTHRAAAASGGRQRGRVDGAGGGRARRRDGATMLRQGVARSEALDLRRRLLARIPPEKQTTRVFANLMCQVYDGAAASPGLDPLCEPLDAICSGWRRMTRARRRTHALRRDGAAAQRRSCLSSRRRTAPTGRRRRMPTRRTRTSRSIRRRRGRARAAADAPALSASAMAPRRLCSATARLGPSRAHSGGPSTSSCGRRTVRRAGSRGLFPVRFVSGDAGDVVFALGSLWHSSSSCDVRCAVAAAGAGGAPSPRLALLYEYAPAFSAALHRFRPELCSVRRALSGDSSRP